MLLGVIARPNNDRGFSRKILLERVSEDYTLICGAQNQNFSDDVLVNSHLKNNGWQEVLPGEEITYREMNNIVSEAFGIEDAVSDRIVFYMILTLEKVVTQSLL